MKVISPLIDAGDVGSFGGKAANLAKMLQGGLPVPAGFAIRLDVFDKEGKLTDTAKTSIQQLLDKSKVYAVRSSALSEDAEDASWAGQFESFLNIKPEDVPVRVVECHNSAKARAKAYAGEQSSLSSFNVAVVIQEMVQPEYAGVLFTKDPITGKNHLVTEYIEGLGEKLVSGSADPKQITWKPGEKPDTPFDIDQLTTLAQKVEKEFGKPQDIEWAWAGNQIWLVQTRPITVTQTQGKGYYLGEPEEIFYWGPSRALPLYMSDFSKAAEDFFISMAKDSTMPNPPKTLVLFWEEKVVWLISAVTFGEFAEKTFEAYEKRDKLDEDITNWQEASKSLTSLRDKAFNERLLEAWHHTLFAEFSLYGAESAIAKRLERFDAADRQNIWGAFTVPDNSTFLARIDQELLASRDPKAIASKYPWIQDGYEGISKASPIEYFTKRLEMLSEESDGITPPKKSREELIEKLGLSKEEVSALTLARKLAEFMDDRKAWMMQPVDY